VAQLLIIATKATIHYFLCRNRKTSDVFSIYQAASLVVGYYGNFYIIIQQFHTGLLYSGGFTATQKTPD
jgi:hypothetical protein